MRELIQDPKFEDQLSEVEDTKWKSLKKYHLLTYSLEQSP
jgi:hypothetical protein